MAFTAQTEILNVEANTYSDDLRYLAFSHTSSPINFLPS
jgi:hypothetical protein